MAAPRSLDDSSERYNQRKNRGGPGFMMPNNSKWPSAAGPATVAERGLSSIMAIASGYTEAQLVVMVLSVVVIAVALLSYFVVAPEYEKHLDKQYAAMVHASSERHLHNQKAHELLFGRINLRKHKSLGAWDIESGSSDDDGMGRCTRQRRHSQMRLPPSSASSALDMVSEAGQLARKERNARRRKSESDALKQANIQRADMLRRRVLLRKLEEEIAGTVKANEEAQAAATSGNSNSAIANVRRLSNNALDLSDDRLKMLQEHPADCVEELTVLARAQSPTASTTLMDNATMTKGKMETVPDLHEVKRALKVLHDVLSFYLSVDHRDMNKLTVFCNSLLQHDGLNRLRAFEASRDQDVRALSNSIIEKAVPAIWH
ncbi:hypothetical protein PC118_g20455 [Phytophthora cactorum]|uniref:Uncharacterized protein n=1 Tax=Phytophthora cactorum TaxID=29920 RepID=A0A8T1F5L0_9STRA|nr:hypothetical protein PC118_g20455 [Phytophthora cactorum]